MKPVQPEPAPFGDPDLIDKRPMTRKARKKARRDARSGVASIVAPPAPKPPTASLRLIKPLTIGQSKVFKAFSNGHLLIHGYAGTGKSYLALSLLLREWEAGAIDKLILVRSAVPSRTQGFLPGTDEEKAAIFEWPYRMIVDDLFDKSGHYNKLKHDGVIEFVTTSYLRGLTWDRAGVFFDEVQNYTDQEINTGMTRLGEECHVVIAGDFRQNDLESKRYEESCISSLVETIGRMESFTSVELGIDDIVRSGLVKEWIIAREEVM